MVQFNLPQNSKIEVGKHYQDKTNSKNIKNVNVYRWDPSTGQNPRVDTFEVDMESVRTNIIYARSKVPASQVVDQVGGSGVDVLALGPNLLRLVTHLHITDEDIDRTLIVFKELYS